MIVNRVREIREGIGMLQSELSAKSGVSRRMISELETNKKVDCKVSTLQAIAAALGVSVNEAFTIE